MTHEPPEIISDRGLAYWSPIRPTLGGQVNVSDSSLAWAVGRDGNPVTGPAMWLRLLNHVDPTGRRAVVDEASGYANPETPEATVQITAGEVRALRAKLDAWLAAHDEESYRT